VTFPKKRLLVILGSGSSMPCCMPSVANLDNKMKDWCREWKPPAEVVFRSACTRWEVFNDLWGMVESYYKKREALSLPLRVNFEKVLGEMIALAYWVTPAPFGNALRLAVENPRLSSRFFPWSAPAQSDALHLHQITIKYQLAYLLENLATHMRERSMALNKDAPNFLAYRSILSRLRDEFEVGVYNLNYDNVAISAWPDAFTGFRHGQFDARAVSVRKEWEFIYPLHGSVHYSLASEQRANILWMDDLTRSDFTDSTSVSSTAEEFKPLVPTTLIAGAFKLDQLLADPFQTFYASLVRHAHEADALLVAGYGFGDVHVNRALQNMFSHPPGSDSRLPPVVVITKSDASTQQMGIRQNSDNWAQRLGETLRTSFDWNQPVPQKLIEKNAVELDLQKRVAIWHGGFVEAGAHLDAVVDWLYKS